MSVVKHTTHHVVRDGVRSVIAGPEGGEIPGVADKLLLESGDNLLLESGDLLLLE